MKSRLNVLHENNKKRIESQFFVNVTNFVEMNRTPARFLLVPGVARPHRTDRTSTTSTILLPPILVP